MLVVLPLQVQNAGNKVLKNSIRRLSDRMHARRRACVNVGGRGYTKYLNAVLIHNPAIFPIRFIPGNVKCIWRPFQFYFTFVYLWIGM